MTPLQRLQRAYDVHAYDRAGEPSLWVCTCLRCPMRYKLFVHPRGPTAALLEPLWSHAYGHEEVTRRVRLTRGTT